MKIKAKTPIGAACELKRYMIKKLSDGSTVNNNWYDRSIVIRTRGESLIHDGIDAVTMTFEGGPYEWSIALTSGGDMLAWQLGHYSKPGDFPTGVSNKHIFVEPQNHYQLCFYKEEGMSK